MNTRFVKWHKHEELEKIASEIHDRFKCAVPIDIDYLVETMDLDIRDISRLKEDFGVYGLLAKVKDRYTIIVEKGHLKSTNYYTNFTIAEELAHFRLHKDYFRNVNSLDEAVNFFVNLVSKNSKMMIELNAKYLAGAILLPREHVRKRAMEVYQNNKITFSEILSKGDEDLCESIIEAIASSLCDIYHVPDGPIAYRLRTPAVGFRKFIQGKYKECN